MRELRTRSPLRSIGAALLLFASTGFADAASPFPTRPIRILVNTGPGGLLDVTTRVVAEKLGENLGQPVIVENRAGGDGLVGILAAKAAQADGYTLLASAATIAIQPAVKLNPGYDLKKDFAAIGPMLRSPFMIVVGAREPSTTLADFVMRAKSAPDKMSYASAGVGTTTHMGAAMFLKQAGVEILHVPYKGNGPALPDVMAGRVNMIFEGYAAGSAKVKEGTLRALAVTSLERLPGLPDTPTVAEGGVQGFSYYVYNGLLAPAGTPKDVISRLAGALQLVLADQDVQRRFHEGGGEVLRLSPDEFQALLLRDVLEMGKLAQELGLERK